jgi:acyl-CoA synthetase (AMP-forming)/AMP-acid ligase II
VTVLPDVIRPPARLPLVAGLRDHGDRIAVITRDGRLTYRELADRVDDVAQRLGSLRRLVLVPGANNIDALVTYLGALCGGHVVLLAAGDNAPAIDGLIAAYDPDVVARPAGGEWLLDERRELPAHELHPDLALLLSTSGSTGSPKLVRLSYENLQANAAAIVDYLGIRSSDRAATSLPMHYCYGLSVVHSHLLAGATLILTDLSVVDACFWDVFREAGGTTFAGVPHTFDLLDRVGFATMRLPRLRYITQAGGRLAPETVRRYAGLGRSQGWDFYVMYGQTEATARMAYLPPSLAASRPEAVGVPIAGGTFALEPVPEAHGPDVGELVYYGPNVMLGYAESPADLAAGRTVHALRTGDLARRAPDGLYEIVGRRSRFAKIAGLRVDLQRVEELLADVGITAYCTSADDELVIAVERGHISPDEIARLVAGRCGLPRGRVHGGLVEEVPRLPTGKPDYQALVPAIRKDRPGRSPAAEEGSVLGLYAALLDRPDATDGDSFVGLGGDSLSYVEMSVRLEQRLGHLPDGWHTMAIRELDELARSGRRRSRRGFRSLETGVAVRAVATVLIVGAHLGLFSVLGSAHVLLAVAGFNFARFQLTDATRAERLRHQLASLARVVVPSVVFIAAIAALTGKYGLANVFLLNAIVGPPTWTSSWHFWFIEVLVYILVMMAALMAVPWVDRMERRHPFRFVLALVAVGLAFRFELIDIGIPHTKPAFWLFALGWAIARASTVRERLLLSGVVVASVPGFFGNPGREAVMILGLLMLLWVGTVVVPAGLGRVMSVLASSSLYIYLVHWQVYPLLQADFPVAALLASLVAGVLYWQVATRAMAWLSRHVPRPATADRHASSRSGEPSLAGTTG